MSSKHFKLILPDEGKDIFMPCEGQDWGYRYGPSIMCHDGICEAWFASPGDGYEADWFTYRKSTDGGKTWSNEKVVLSPTPNSMDWFSVCDPAVFKYGKYYYIGYTSTIFNDFGGVCNNTFVARSESPEGPFEKWNGHGWGEQQNGCHWVGKPAPIFYFDEEWHNWGCGEPSFVVKDNVLYIYYTWWTSRSKNSNSCSETRVATADITNENWPETIVERGIAAVRSSAANDSWDVVYCEDLDKFISLSTDKRFTEESFLSVSESDDGITFRKVNEIRSNTSFMLHNCGISGDCLHHIKKGDTMILGYAYGNQWGKWGTRFHNYTFEGMDEEYFSDSGKNIARDFSPWKRPDPMFNIHLFATAKHYVRLYVGESVEAPLGVFDHCYHGKPVKNARFYNYDSEIIGISGNVITAIKPGLSYVSCEFDGLFCEFAVYVDTPDVTRKPEDKHVVGFMPICGHYVIDSKTTREKQIRGIADYSDGTFYEVSDPKDGITFESLNPELFAVNANGIVKPTGKLGKGSVKVSCFGFAFDVTIEVK